MMEFKVADLCDEFGEKARVLEPIFSDFGGKRRCWGEAVTVTCFEDNSRIKELSGQSGAGKILVIDGGGSDRCALVGDMIGADLCHHGWLGVVVYGYIRDSAELATLPIVVKALGTMPRRPHRRGEGRVGEIVTFAGQQICHGDRLYIDEDGVIILNELIGS